MSSAFLYCLFNLTIGCHFNQPLIQVFPPPPNPIIKVVKKYKAIPVPSPKPIHLNEDELVCPPVPPIPDLIDGEDEMNVEKIKTFTSKLIDNNKICHNNMEKVKEKYENQLGHR